MFIGLLVLGACAVPGVAADDWCPLVDGSFESEDSALLQLRGARKAMAASQQGFPDQSTQVVAGAPAQPSNFQVGRFDQQPAHGVEASGINHEAREELFAAPFDVPPVVLAGVVSSNGSHPVVPEVTTATEQSATLRLREPDCYDLWHTTETLDWMALPAGVHLTDQGVRFVVGRSTAEGLDWHSVEFPGGIDEDVVVVATVVHSHDGPGQWTNLRVRNVRGNGFDVLPESATRHPIGGPLSVTIGYFAIPVGVGSISDHLYEARVTPPEITHEWSVYEMTDVQRGAVFASLTHNGWDTGTLRMQEGEGGSLMLRVDEPERCGWDGPHPAPEQAFIFAVEVNLAEPEQQGQQGQLQQQQGVEPVLGSSPQGGPDPQTTQPPIEETTEAPMEETTEAPMQETTEAPMEETTEAPMEETTEAPIEETTEAPMEETTEAPMEETSEAPMEETTEAPIEETSEAPMEETTEAPTEETTEAPTEEPTEAPTEETTEAPMEETTEAPTEETTEGPMEETTEAPTEETTGAATEETTEAPTEETTEAPTEETTEAPTQETTERSHLKLNSARVDHTPTEVAFETPLKASPVVIAGVPSFFGGDAVVPVVVSAAAGSAKLRLHEPDCYDGRHLKEQLDWLAISPGNHTTEQGVAFVVGTAEVSGSQWTRVLFPERLTGGGIVVVPTLQRESEEWTNLRLKNVNAAGFEVLLEASRRNEQHIGGVTLGYIAIPAGRGTIDGRRYVAQVTPFEITHAWSKYTVDLADAAVFAGMTHVGWDTASLRLHRGRDGVFLRAHEPQRCGWDIVHPAKERAFLLFVEQAAAAA
eukprot:CAMPEP_0204449734 /NCGR_PEP_ID=MMETSP0470-20130426/99989_1 /ASSEMBLY_ACC=CAM_ASM_000385 /TAXON_ID=2969 /ORGANISM="Oxyrrhis marina" /LENGTH=816 /DNA_ID=CAMNT_0051449557 /DNA_START=62 /DNA_END=2512 /DNA_ORIENTATION=+